MIIGLVFTVNSMRLAHTIHSEDEPVKDFGGLVIERKVEMFEWIKPEDILLNKMIGGTILGTCGII